MGIVILGAALVYLNGSTNQVICGERDTQTPPFIIDTSYYNQSGSSDSFAVRS
jgi:hypothetical protein